MPVRSGLPSSGLAILRTPPLRRVRRATERNQDVAAGRAVDLYPDRAVVDVEERPICAKGVEPQVVLGERLDDLVDIGLALVRSAAPAAAAFSITPCSGRRDFCSMSVRSFSADASGGMAPAIGSRPSASPVISFCSWSTLALNCVPFSSTVPSTVLRLLMTSPMSWSRAARFWVNALVVDKQIRQRATLALQQFDDGVAHLVDLGAVQPLEHRPQTAEQRVEIERGLGVLLRDGRSRRAACAAHPGPDVISRYRSPTRFS